MNYLSEITDSLEISCQLFAQLKEKADVISRIAEAIIKAYKLKKKVLVFGNGGSAADAQHIAGELVGRFQIERKALPAIALNTNASILTSIGNDYCFENIFLRQLEAHMAENDIVIGLSTSGNSKNVIEALKYAKQHDAITIGIVGEKPCLIDEIAEHVLKIPSPSTPRIQEGTMAAAHIICALVEKTLVDEKII